MQVSGSARNVYPHRGSPPQLVVSLDRATMELHQLLYQRQTDTGAFMGARLRGATAKEPIEYMHQVLGCDPTTTIDDRQPDVLALQALHDTVLARECELQRVG